MEVLDKAQGEIGTKTGNRVTLKYFPGGQQVTSATSFARSASVSSTAPR